MLLRKKALLALVALLAAVGIAVPAPADNAGSPVEILVLSVPGLEQIGTVQPGGTLELTSGDTVRLRMSVRREGGSTGFPSTRFKVVSGEARLAVKSASEDVGNITFAAYTVRNPKRNQEETVIQYEILNPIRLPDQLRTGTIRVDVRDRPPEPPPPPPPPAEPSVSFSGIILYEHENFGGRSQNVTVDQVPSLRGTVLGNDVASSVRIQPGCRAVLYQDENFGGRSIVVTVDIRALRSTGLGNDSLSSLTLDCSDAAGHDRHDRRHRR